MLPSGDILELIIVATGLAGLSGAVLYFRVRFYELVFGTEVASAGFLAIEGIVAEDLGEIDEVGNATCFFKFNIEAIYRSGDPHVGPKFVTDGRNAL